MTISFSPIENGNRWAGYDWSIDNDEELAELVAYVALGQYRHVLRVLAETDCIAAAPTRSVLEGARQLLTVPSGADPFHRDGWLFQVIAWIAARIQNETSLIAPPHMQHAEKGFDGLHVHIDEETGTVQTAVICEDKATTNPRQTIRDQVWKEFETLETGERDNLLAAKVSTLLESRPDLDPDQAIRQVFWSQARAYRVAITVDDTHGDANGRRRLFKGYHKTVSGDVSRRRAETLHLDDLRSWMDRIASMALQAAERTAVADV